MVTDVTSTGSATSSRTDSDRTVAARTPQKTLGQNDFLKLLATQFQKQDPMKPMEDTAFIAQMAQFSALEQSATTATEMAALRADQLRLTANSYLGHRVTVQSADGTTSTGEVEAIDGTGAQPLLVVGGAGHPLGTVVRVEPRHLSSPQPGSSGGA